MKKKGRLILLGNACTYNMYCSTVTWAPSQAHPYRKSYGILNIASDQMIYDNGT